MNGERFVINAIASSDWHMETLRAARTLALPDWAIGAGFVRNAVWDRLHGLSTPTPLTDIDVLFFDQLNVMPERDWALEEELTKLLPDRPWSVRNQARMHVRNDDPPYASTEDAMRYWLELPTAVAVHLEDDDRLSLLAPFGLDHLNRMQGAPTPAGRQKWDQYLARMRAKNWPATWPKVAVEGLD